jgi:UDPglucose 6-dehydrogenase
MIIAFYGLGKLGLPYAALLADKGHAVVGIDPNDEVRDAVSAGTVPPWIAEPGLEELVERVVKALTLRVVNFDHPDLLEAQASIILVPTPSLEDGSFSLEYVLQVCRDIGRRIAGSTEEHLVLLVSTVSPGSTGGPIRRTLECASGSRVWPGFIDLVYCPEFVQLGNVLEGMKSPAAILAGLEGHPDLLDELIVAENDPPVFEMSWESAELAKLGLNVALSLKPKLANILGAMAAYYGADVDRITNFIGKDPRIGKAYLRAGLQPGGPCLPRDLRALLAAGEDTNADLGTISAMVYTNEEEAVRWIAFIRRLGRRHFNTEEVAVAILGRTYKVGVPVIVNSLGEHLYQVLASMLLSVQAYDSALRIGLAIERVVQPADVVVITQMDEAFKALEEMDLSLKVIVDPWRMLKPGLVCKAYYGGLE